LHGNREKNIFTKTDLNDLYGKPQFQKFLANIFGSYTVLFVGCSFRDEKIKEYLELHAQNQSKGLKIHHALIPSDLSDPPPQSLEELYGIEPLIYQKHGNNYENFDRSIYGWAAPFSIEEP